MWVDRMFDPLCDLEIWPHPWPWPWISRSNFEIGVSQGSESRWNKMYESAGCWTHYVPLNFDLIHDLHIECLDIQVLVSLDFRKGWSVWFETKGIWIDSIMLTLYDLDLWPYPWPWPGFFKVKIWKQNLRNLRYYFSAGQKFSSFICYMRWW